MLYVGVSSSGFSSSISSNMVVSPGGADPLNLLGKLSCKYITLQLLSQSINKQVNVLCKNYELLTSFFASYIYAACQ